MRGARSVARPPIRVHALPATLAALRTHIFNGVIWPDFTRLPDRSSPMLRFVNSRSADVLTLAGRCIEVLPAVHTVPAVGFAVRGAPMARRGAWVFSGDTGPNPALWARLRGMRIGARWSSKPPSPTRSWSWRASASTCARRCCARNWPGSTGVDVFITHIKPGELDVVMSEIAGSTARTASAR